MGAAGLSSILFVCDRNAVRSPMARALTVSRFPRRFYTASAGVAPGDRDTFVDIILAEVGIDLGQHHPLALEDLGDLNFDLAITLSPRAHHHMLDVARSHAMEVEYWPTPDPTVAIGTRSQILSAYRDVREHLGARIGERLGALAN